VEKKILVKEQKRCGTMRVFPACEESKKIAHILGKECLSPTILERIKELGIEIVMEIENNNKKIR
jgi:hypothetical protein